MYETINLSLGAASGIDIGFRVRTGVACQWAPIAFEPFVTFVSAGSNAG